MKASIIEIGLPTDKVAEVRLALEASLQETGDTLIGQQVYDDLTLLVIRLFSNMLQSHLTTLSEVLSKELIHSFQVVHCQLFKVVFREESARVSLRDFPLHMGESWFEAADEENAAYLCLDSPYLSQEQISWLATQTAIAQWTKSS